MHHADLYIAFGANLGDPALTFTDILKEIPLRLGPVVSCSRLYKTKPLTPPQGSNSNKQPSYFNAVIKSRSSLAPDDIMQRLLDIESRFGRSRDNNQIWQPRIIDLDLLFVDSKIVSSRSLTLPHPRLHERDFVLVPLFDIAPDLIHPLTGKSVTTMLKEYQECGLERFVDDDTWDRLKAYLSSRAANL